MSKPKSTPTPPAEPAPSVDWRTDPRAQELMSMLVAAGIAMHKERQAGKAKSTGARAQAPRSEAPAPTRRNPQKQLATMDLSTS